MVGRVTLVGLLLMGGAALLVSAPLRFTDGAPNPQVTQPQASIEQATRLTPEEQARARARARQGRRLFLGAQLYEGVLLVGFLLLGGTRWLAGVVARFGTRWVPALAAVVGVVALGSLVLTLALGMLLSLVAMPLGNAFSRQVEWEADRYAVRIYPHPEAGIAAFYKMARLNVAEMDPPRWVEMLLASHPSLARRIAYLEGVQATR
jgi:Zn-dependent protease with chaperone function